MSEERIVTISLSAAAAVVAATMLSSVGAFAGGEPGAGQVPTLVPYRGTLERDGEPYEGTVDIRFRLHAEQQPAPDAPSLWEETQSAQVHGGRFAVLLGSTSPHSAESLREALVQGRFLSVALLVGQGDEQQVVPLSNPQRFYPAPYAIWNMGQPSSDFRVSGDVLLQGSSVVLAPHPSLGDGGRALGHGPNDTLLINVEGDFMGGTRIEDHVSVTGSLEVGMDLTVGRRLDIGLEYVRCENSQRCTCPEGKNVISATAYCLPGYVLADATVEGGVYESSCEFPGEVAAPRFTTLACARVQW